MMPLEWSDTASRHMTWDVAMAWAAGLGDGWRLPTDQELVNEWNHDKSCPRRSEWVFDIYWSPTTFAGDPGLAWAVDFFDGYVYAGFKTIDLHVRAVQERK